MPKRRRKTYARITSRFPFVQLGGVSKGDFVALAAAFCRHGASDALVQDVAGYFSQQNPRFNRSRFVAATKRC